MPLVGNLRDFALHDFLYLIDRGHKTGSLLLRSHNDSAALYFDAGKLISVTRPQRRERLGEFLMRTGKITPDQLRQLLQADETGTSIKVFTIAYGTGSDVDTELMKRIAEASGAKTYTSDPASIEQVYRDIATFF